MRIAYITTDEVNEDLAVRMAADCDTKLCPWSPKDGPPDGRFDAVVYDLDYLPPHQREQVLAELFSGLAPSAVAVHSYNLDDKRIEILRERGVIVSQRLEPEMLMQLRLAADGRPAGGCGPTALEL
jgi:hypothetical protein